MRSSAGRSSSRARSQDDRRGVTVRLTDLGRETLSGQDAWLRGRQRAFFDGLAGDRARAAPDLLVRLAGADRRARRRPGCVTAERARDRVHKLRTSAPQAGRPSCRRPAQPCAFTTGSNTRATSRHSARREPWDNSVRRSPGASLLLGRHGELRHPLRGPAPGRLAVAAPGLARLAGRLSPRASGESKLRDLQSAVASTPPLVGFSADHWPTRCR